MANNQNREMLTGLALDLLKIGAKALIPAAKDAFYAYRDSVLERLEVSPAERAELLEWIGVNVDDGPTGTPSFPTDPNQAIEADGQHLTSQPDFSRIGPKDQVWFHPDPNGDGSGPRWFVAPIRDMSGIDHQAAGWRVVFPIEE